MNIIYIYIFYIGIWQKVPVYKTIYHQKNDSSVTRTIHEME